MGICFMHFRKTLLTQEIVTCVGVAAVRPHACCVISQESMGQTQSYRGQARPHVIVLKKGWVITFQLHS